MVPALPLLAHCTVHAAGFADATTPPLFVGALLKIEGLPFANQPPPTAFAPVAQVAVAVPV